MLSFIETLLFTRLVYDYLSDEEHAALQAHLAQDPECGEVVPGSGGATESIPAHVLRKIRQELSDDED